MTPPPVVKFFAGDPELFKIPLVVVDPAAVTLCQTLAFAEVSVPAPGAFFPDPFVGAGGGGSSGKCQSKSSFHCDCFVFVF